MGEQAGLVTPTKVGNHVSTPADLAQARSGVTVVSVDPGQTAVNLDSARLVIAYAGAARACGAGRIRTLVTVVVPEGFAPLVLRQLAHPTRSTRLSARAL